MATRRKADKPAISPERLAEIKESARRPASEDAASIRSLGPTCRCGVRRKPAGLAKHVIDDGLCVVHPERPPQPYVPGVGKEG